MPEYLGPGVFIGEISARQKAIEGIGTSTAGFAGMTERGPVAGLPVLVTSYAEFMRIFGNPLPLPDPNGNGYLARAVQGFFENDGKRCFIARIVGIDGNAPTDDDYVGVDNGPGRRTGIQSLAEVDDIRIIAAPGRTSALVQNALIAQCERMRYRFAVLDGECDPAGGFIHSVLAHRDQYDTSFAAYYVPWVEVAENNQRLLVPPSGHIAGIYARVDVTRGVSKAPANEVVRGITGLSRYITNAEQVMLNPRGVNCIRQFAGRGLRVWGARTLSSDAEFRYINVRRLLMFLEASIGRGTQCVAFESNTPETWERVRESVSAFLYSLWRDGALAGSKPEDAYFVRCDETTMTATDMQNGRLICLIGIAIILPAEFVILRIVQSTSAA